MCANTPGGGQTHVFCPRVDRCPHLSTSFADVFGVAWASAGPAVCAGRGEREGVRTERGEEESWTPSGKELQGEDGTGDRHQEQGQQGSSEEYRENGKWRAQGQCRCSVGALSRARRSAGGGRRARGIAGRCGNCRVSCVPPVLPMVVPTDVTNRWTNIQGQSASVVLSTGPAFARETSAISGQIPGTRRSGNISKLEGL